MSTIESKIIVNDFLQRKTLLKMGYNFDVNELTDFEVKAFCICEAKFNSLEKKMLEQKYKGTK